MPSFGLVLSVINIYIPTSQRATYEQSFLHVYAHIGANMPMRVCTHAHNHSRMYMHTYVQSCLHAYEHIGTIMPTRICHAHACMHT
jgi:hypothetical protein